MITKAIKHITIGQTKRLYKPVGYTMLANFINIVPFCLSIEVINTLFKAFDGTGTPLNISKLWGLDCDNVCIHNFYDFWRKEIL